MFCNGHHVCVLFTGPVFGNKDNFTGLGVFVDTYPNEEKQLEVGDTSTLIYHIIKSYIYTPSSEDGACGESAADTV